MIAWRPTSWKAMFCAEWRAVLAIASTRAVRPGKLAAKLSACIPPIEPPTTACSRPIPSASSSATCARTMSRTVMTGKRIAHGAPSPAGLAGPVEPMQPPITLAQMTWKRLVSIGLPGPTIRSHQPGLPVTGCVLARYWSPVSAWNTRIAFALSAASSP
jgi:hypothetical protein